jgi:hypothetical protein
MVNTPDSRASTSQVTRDLEAGYSATLCIWENGDRNKLCFHCFCVCKRSPGRGNWGPWIRLRLDARVKVSDPRVAPAACSLPAIQEPLKFIASSQRSEPCRPIAGPGNAPLPSSTCGIVPGVDPPPRAGGRQRPDYRPLRAKKKRSGGMRVRFCGGSPTGKCWPVPSDGLCPGRRSCEKRCVGVSVHFR